MGDSYNDPNQGGRNFEDSRNGGRGNFRGNRGPGRRDGGGFRIRLSDNEMRSAKTIQEAFNLRSTVAVLGFATRTLGQMLEEGKLEDLITEYRSERNNFNQNTMSNKNGQRHNSNPENNSKSGNKPNPFARPDKPETQLPAKENEGSSSSKEENLEIQNDEKEKSTETIPQATNSSLEQSNEIEKNITEKES